jgi:hypothetical protein
MTRCVEAGVCRNGSEKGKTTCLSRDSNCDSSVVRQKVSCLSDCDIPAVRSARLQTHTEFQYRQPNGRYCWQISAFVSGKIVSVQAIMLWASALTAPRALNPHSIKISKSINTQVLGAFRRFSIAKGDGLL